MRDNFDTAGFTKTITDFQTSVNLPKFANLDIQGILDELGNLTNYYDKDPVELSEWAIKLTYYNVFLNSKKANLMRNIRFYQKQLDTIVGTDMANDPSLRTLYGKTAERLVCAQNPRAGEIDVKLTELHGQHDTLDNWTSQLESLVKSIEKFIYVKKQAKFSN
jgi:hypothetical protein